MKKSLTSLATIALVAASSLSQAQTPASAAPAAAPEPADSLTYNMGAVTDYRYRGISQSKKTGALQAGVDFVSASGFYVGAWGSQITWIKDTDPTLSTLKGKYEIDIYGGYKKEIAKDTILDVGVLQYWYKGNTLTKVIGAVNANTTEVYGAVSYGPITVKLSDSVTPLFGMANTSGSRYLDISYTIDMGDGLTIVPHAGDQYVKHTKGVAAPSYSDFSLTVNKDINGLVIYGTVIGTNFKRLHGNDFGGNPGYTLPGSGAKNLADTALVVGIKKNF